MTAKSADRHMHGDVVQPDERGCCGKCGGAAFDYSNGHEFAVDGTRGYRCAVCSSIKSEDWRRFLIVVDGVGPCCSLYARSIDRARDYAAETFGPKGWVVGNYQPIDW